MQQKRATSDTEKCGFIFACSGVEYSLLAEQAVKSVRKSNPGYQVDIFTDSTVDNSLFDRVFELEKSWFRPKFEAMIRSRFDKTIYLDSDLVVLGDVSDVFWLLDRFEFAACHVQNRNARFANKKWENEIPNSFPQINGGVMAFRRTPGTSKFLQSCNRILREQNLSEDQPLMRELLLKCRIQLAILPPEYNIRKHDIVSFSNSNNSAPRILHSSKFFRLMKNNIPPQPRQVYSRIFMRHVNELIAADQNLFRGSKRKVYAMYDIHKKLFQWAKEDIRAIVGNLFGPRL